MKNKKLLYAIIIVVIALGLIIELTKGFNFGLTYNANEKVEVYIGKDINKSEIRDIAKEAFETDKIKIQTVEIFEDMAAVTVPSTTDEQIDKFVQLVNEKYTLEVTKDDVTIVKVPSTTVANISNNYKIPVLSIILAGAVYMAIRYWRLGYLKIAGCTILICVVAEALLASVYSIFRIPVNEFTMPIAMAVLGFALFAEGIYYNKKEELKDSEEELVRE